MGTDPTEVHIGVKGDNDWIRKNWRKLQKENGLTRSSDGSESFRVGNSHCSVSGKLIELWDIYRKYPEILIFEIFLVLISLNYPLVV